MSSEAVGEPILFARRFLERHGALIDSGPGSFDAVLPRVLSERLGLPEYVSITGQGGEGDGRHAVGYGSPLLEKMVDLSCDPLPLASAKISFHYVKSQGFDRLVQDQFRFHKALYKGTSTAPIRTAYLVLTCRYEARSDEQKEGIVSLVFHFETGALIPQRSLEFSNGVMEAASLPESLRDGVRWERILKALEREAPDLVSGEIKDFQDSMNRRLARDVRNLEEYFETLKKEMELSLGRSGLSDRLVQDRKEKIAMIPEDLARKKEDLLKKYSIRVKIFPAAALFIRTPAVKLLGEVFLGREKRPLPLVYNPLTRALDPLACEGCGRSVTSVFFCGRRHALCSRCHDECPACKG